MTSGGILVQIQRWLFCCTVSFDFKPSYFIFFQITLSVHPSKKLKQFDNKVRDLACYQDCISNKKGEMVN